VEGSGEHENVLSGCTQTINSWPA